MKLVYLFLILMTLVSCGSHFEEERLVESSYLSQENLKKIRSLSIKSQYHDCNGLKFHFFLVGENNRQEVLNAFKTELKIDNVIKYSFFPSKANKRPGWFYMKYTGLENKKAVSYNDGRIRIYPREGLNDFYLIVW